MNLENLKQQEAEQILSLKQQHLTELSNIAKEKELVRKIIYFKTISDSSKSLKNPIFPGSAKYFTPQFFFYKIHHEILYKIIILHFLFRHLFLIYIEKNQKLVIFLEFSIF